MPSYSFGECACFASFAVAMDGANVDLSSADLSMAWHPAAPSFEAALSYRENKEKFENDFERRYLTWLMERSQGNISRAAREADVDRKYLHKLLKKQSIVA